MKLNRTESPLSRVERNKINENWQMVENNHNNLTEQANDMNTAVNKRINNIIAESGTSSTEVVDARGTHTVLGDRLNEINQEIGDMSLLGSNYRSLSKTVVERGVNVKDFGAVGDGVTDDTQAFINMLNSPELNMFIPNGTYLITQPIEITNDNTTIISKGTLFFDVENETCLEVSSNRNNIEISIDGNNTARIGIDVLGENNIIHNSTVKNIYSNNNSALGINVVNNNNIVEKCLVENVESVGNEIGGDSNGASRGVRVTGLSTNNGSTLIKNNIINNITGEEGDSIHLIAPDKDSMEVVVDGNKIHTFSRRAIKIQCSDTKILNNVIENYTDHISLIRAIDVQGVDNTVIMHNTLMLEHIAGIGLAGTEDKTVNNTVVSNNKIKMFDSRTPIFANYTNNFDCLDNRIEGGGSCLFNRGNKVKIVNNILDSLLTESSNFPISVMGGGDDVLIMSNTVSNSVYHRPLRSNYTNVKIIGNNFTDYTGGIELSSTGSGFVVNNVIKSVNVVSTSTEGYTVENNTLIPV